MSEPRKSEGATHEVKISSGFHVICTCGWSSAKTDPKRDAWALFAEHEASHV